MSKFHILNIVSIFMLLVIFSVGGPLLSIFILALVYLAVLAIGAAFIQLNFYLNSLNKGQTSQKQIALTFDDGPDAEVTPKVMELLSKHQAKATFFCIGEKIEKQGELLKKLDKDGHLIANHSYSHSGLFSLFFTKRIVAELDLTSRLIEKNIGKKPKLFRPPFGVTNPTVATALAKTGLISIGWSLRSFDTTNNSVKVLRKLRRKLKPGDVVLFHDNLKNTPQILEAFLPWLLENHFEVVGLEELLKVKTYEKI